MLETHLVKVFSELSSTNAPTTKNVHLSNLAAIRQYTKQIHTNRTCLCCLLRSPEKRLICGHTLCNTCIRTFGSRSRDAKYRFTLDACLLCQLDVNRTFDLLPPTAGIRVLTIDGGGVRGMVPLVVLRQIEMAFLKLSVSLIDMFDLVCGSSAGSLTYIDNRLRLSYFYRRSCDIRDISHGLELRGGNPKIPATCSEHISPTRVPFSDASKRSKTRVVVSPRWPVQLLRDRASIQNRLR